jgi:putative phosphoesterase
MKIALISDIHANLPALEACLRHIDQQDVDTIYCLGDLVGYNIWPNEVVRLVRQRGIPTIAGNYDFGVGRNSDDCGCAYKTEEDQAMGKMSIAYTNQLMDDNDRSYLRRLPAQLKVTFKGTDGLINLLLVHGSPRKVNEYLFEDRDEKSLLRMMREADADIMCFGHTHKPYHRVLQDPMEQKDYYRHAINIGSVGKPKDGNPQGCYVLLNIDDFSAVENPASIHVTFQRFSYDLEKAATAIEGSPLPAKYADMLRKAY